MIDVVITSYREKESTMRAAQTFLKQAGKRKDVRVIVVDPFPEVGSFLKSKIRDKRFVFYPDPGEGKSYALNLLFQEYSSSNKDDIFILTDGDVFVSDNTLKTIEKAFKNPSVGCLTGRPVSVNSVDTKYGWWAHVVFKGIDRARRSLSARNSFLECSGYLFAIRKGVILDFPMETSEDSVIPYLFWKKGYQIKYVPEAEVFVKNPENWKDWIAQKVRNIKAHENLARVAPGIPRTKSFFGEIWWGAGYAIRQPRNLKQVLWTIELYFARLWLYVVSFKELGSKKKYQDGWRGEVETKSTRMG